MRRETESSNGRNHSRRTGRSNFARNWSVKQCLPWRLIRQVANEINVWDRLSRAYVTFATGDARRGLQTPVMAATSSASAMTCDPMKFQAHDFLDQLIITPQVLRSALEPAIESLDLYMAGKYAGAVISRPVAMAAAQDAREFLSANYPNLQFQLEVDMTQLREGEIKFVIDIKGVRF